MKTEGRLPDFVLIGGMRCGSSTLWMELSKHQSIYTLTCWSDGTPSSESVIVNVVPTFGEI